MRSIRAPRPGDQGDRAVGVETGGSNVQFAVDPESGEIVVIEMNRASRAPRRWPEATGFPIAKIAAKLAVGYRARGDRQRITGVTPASSSRRSTTSSSRRRDLPFEKFPGSDGRLTDPMKSVGR